MKMIFILIILISAGLLLANPIMEGPYITEIFFDETGWSIELFNMMTEDNLDNCKLSSNAGEAYFLTGILFPWGTYLVVTQDDLQTPLVIDEQDDHVTSYYYEYEISWCTFGTLQTMVLAPTDGQSLVTISFSSNGAMTTDISFCKDNTPTLGGINNNGGIQGIFCGYVFDSLMNPVPNVQIEHFPYNYNSPDVVTNEVCLSGNNVSNTCATLVTTVGTQAQSTGTLSITKSISNITMDSIAIKPIPGATMIYKIWYSLFLNIIYRNGKYH